MAKQTQFQNFYKNLQKNKNNDEFHKIFMLAFLQLYSVFSGKTKSKVRFSIKLLLKNKLAQVLSMLSHVALMLQFKHKRIVLVSISEPTHANEFNAFSSEMDEVYESIIVTDKFRYFFDYLLKGRRVVFIAERPGFVALNSKSELISLLVSNELISTDEELHLVYDVLRPSALRIRSIERQYKTLASKNDILGVIVFNDLTLLGRTITYLGNKDEIPTFYVMHGLLSDEYIEEEHLSKYFMVYGEATKKLLITKGISADSISVSGAPYLSKVLTNVDYSFLEEIKKNIRIPSDVRVALVALSGPGHTTSVDHHLQIINVLRDFLKKNMGQFFFIFKLHRKDKISYYTGLKEIDNAVVVDFDRFQRKDKFVDWISLADVLITGASTSALEAMLLKIPVITIDLMNEYEQDTLFIRDKTTYHVKSSGEFNQIFHAALNRLDDTINNNALELVETYYYKRNASSCERIVKQIRAVIERV